VHFSNKTYASNENPFPLTNPNPRGKFLLIFPRLRACPAPVWRWKNYCIIYGAISGSGGSVGGWGSSGLQGQDVRVTRSVCRLQEIVMNVRASIKVFPSRRWSEKEQHFWGRIVNTYILYIYTQVLKGIIFDNTLLVSEMAINHFWKFYLDFF